MTRSEIRPAIKAILESAIPSIPVYLDDGRSTIHQQMELALQSGGICIAIQPIIASRVINSTRTHAAQEECEISVFLRQNPDIATSIDHDATVTDVQVAILRDNRNHPFRPWSLATQSTLLDVSDEGNISTDIFFTATIHTK